MGFTINYPNLELIQLKFNQILFTDNQLLSNIVPLLSDNSSEFKIISFPQILISNDLEMVVDAVVVMNKPASVYAIFFNNEFEYLLTDPSEEFFTDLSKMNLKSAVDAQKSYSTSDTAVNILPEDSEVDDG